MTEANVAGAPAPQLLLAALAGAIAADRRHHRIHERPCRSADPFGRPVGDPRPGLGGAIIIAKIALQPLLALAALFFLIRGHLTYALLAMAFIILMTWLNYLPSVAIHGLELQGSPRCRAVPFLRSSCRRSSSWPSPRWR